MPVSAPLDELIGIMRRLRDPENGCAWDIAQTFASVAPYTIEEAYEVADAIERGDREDLRDELGDLLLQVVFHARMAEEEGSFDFDDVARAIADKMVRRHPHVFGEATFASDEERRSGLGAGEGRGACVEGRASEGRAAASRRRRGRRCDGRRGGGPDRGRRRAEQAANGGGDGGGRTGRGDVSALDGVALALPALVRADKLQRRAARVGFDWPEIAPVVAKVEEELGEVAEAAASGESDALEDELGDLLFSAVNLARHHGVDAERALSRANAKFERRFRGVERLASGGRRRAGGARSRRARHALGTRQAERLTRRDSRVGGAPRDARTSWRDKDVAV